ncbi:MAG: enoyl-CoA hydratase/isomerase family protein [Verrucomicrobia bacterium]|nr:enoyl-CoA hydratase/isomerase family protein [Verrucomicrobiota bacterium]
MNINATTLEDGIRLLTFDRPESSANLFDTATMDELDHHLADIESDRSVRGAVFVSTKKSIFIAGVDLKRFHHSGLTTDDIRRIASVGQRVFNRLAALRVPTVAAIHGACLGGGYEMALACDWRVASDDKRTKIGLPETSIGLLPAWGGSTRLPRLIGLPRALAAILPGKRMAPKQAKRNGLVDQVVPREHLLRVATGKIAQGKPSRPGHWFWNNGLVAKLICLREKPKLLKKTGGHYPALPRTLDVMTSGISRSIDASLKLEADGIIALASSPVCGNLIRIFFLQERAKRLRAGKGSAMKNSDKKNAPAKWAAVIGAGVMGAGIAQWLSARGLDVVLRDIDPKRVGQGMATISKLYHVAVKRRILTKVEGQQGVDRIHPAHNEVPLGNTDIIIEAAVEKLDLKKKIFERLDELAGPETILATNTSALPISEIAQATRHPERVIGIHFFNPVHRMQLVEVVVGKATSPETLARSVQFVQKIGRLPVVVRDRPGFLVNRILMPYLSEASRLFADGAAIPSIDQAMLDFGMPMGPMRLLDEVGLDVGHHVATHLAAEFGDRMPSSGIMQSMLDAGQLGRKSGAGFYDYSAQSKPPVNGAAAMLATGRAAAGLSQEQLQDCMVLPMLNEAARCLEENVVADPEDVDLGMIMGTGFPPFRGGPLRHANAVGLAKIVESLERLAKSAGPQFEPCELLQSMAKAGREFYGDK